DHLVRLPSPTRRPSDLAAGSSGPLLNMVARAVLAPSTMRVFWTSVRALPRVASLSPSFAMSRHARSSDSFRTFFQGWRSARARRSEEHTSELQSRENLV